MIETDLLFADPTSPDPNIKINIAQTITIHNIVWGRKFMLPKFLLSLGAAMMNRSVVFSAPMIDGDMMVSSMLMDND